jgi:hypothetical protein
MADTSKNNRSEKAAAEELGISRLTLWRARKAGDLGFLRIGRRVLYTDQHLREFERRNERQPRRRRSGE